MQGKKKSAFSRINSLKVHFSLGLSDLSTACHGSIGILETIESNY